MKMHASEIWSGPAVGHVYCTRSTDDGATWSSPSQIDDNDTAVSIGLTGIKADGAGRLFAVWHDNRIGYLRAWSSTSVDQGKTWRKNVCVYEDTISADSYVWDLFIQPGSNFYLVVGM